MAGVQFTYGITRSYPYRWFKWVVVVGAAVLIAIVSIFNLANNGYTLRPEYTTDPNSTVAHRPWAQKLAAMDNKNAASCQSQNLPVNTEYYTDKQSLAYTIANVWQVDSEERIHTLPSLRYINNSIQSCTLGMIQLDYENADRPAAEIGWITWSIYATGLVTCMVHNDQTTYVNLTVDYNFVPPTIESFNAFRFLQAPEQEAQASLWWAESLLSWYWLNAAARMRNQSGEQDTDGNIYTVNKGSIALFPSQNVTDISSLDFFTNLNYHLFYTSNDDTGDVNPAGQPTTIGGLHAADVWPDVWIESDSFAKVFYSAIMTDLGQAQLNTVLKNTTLLREFSANITTSMSDVETPWLKAGPARAPYDGGGNLTITPSYFYTEYLCEVPTMKSTGALILSLLVADLVFLNAAWTILNFITLKSLERNTPTAHYCAGCVAAVGAGDAVELVDTPTKSNKAAKYRRISNR